MLPDFGPVEDAIREWAQAAGLRVDQVVFNRRGRPVLILPLAATPPPADSRQNVQLEILRVLREKSPLTGTLIYEALCRQGVKASDRTVNGHLAEMVREGTLLNPTGSKPPGYRLPTEADGSPG